MAPGGVQRVLAAMNDVVLVQIVDRVQDLSDSLGRILLRKLPLLANPVEKLSSGRQLRNNVVFVLDAGIVSPDKFSQLAREGARGILLTRTSRQT